MAAYVVVDAEIVEPEQYREYQRLVPATLEKYGGRFLVRGGRLESLEGEYRPRRLVILEFPSYERAKEWYASPEYQAILPIRLQHGHTHSFTVVEGL